MEQAGASPARSPTPELNVFKFIETLIARTGPTEPSTSSLMPTHACANDDRRARQAPAKPRLARRTDIGLFKPGIVKPKARRGAAGPWQGAALGAGQQMPRWMGAPDRGSQAVPLPSAGMPLGMRAGDVIQPDPRPDLVAMPGFCAIPMMPMPVQASDGALMMPMPVAMPMPALDTALMMPAPAGMPLPPSAAALMTPMGPSDGAFDVQTVEGSVRALDGSAHAILHAAGKLTELAERMRARSRDIALCAAAGRQSGDSSEAGQMLAAAAKVMDMAGPLVATAADLFEARAARLQLHTREFRDTAAGPDHSMTRPNSPTTHWDRSVTEPAFDWPSDPTSNLTSPPAANPVSDRRSGAMPELIPVRLVQADTPPPKLEIYGTAADSAAALPSATANDSAYFAMR